ncbi:hypothetical protein GUITHDRAFT_110674 [Guillardia theta CCMP2712]|uniref:ACT domain-containing protein n=1 Tax=Guillardia theta (strain CCMP2712) TaxID=905079 RepID=L1J406_GUITC|nr:hypothetical protein GUITHDRAFT_110674 [Guillardia theta CCMP2712]EKX43258.1 hypothetical protein GUITHDRAFT_110674 [Guillardia theta CCMP2712]|eukprot:XP_005830238.1 hypothetical protein GUITHDRAFT_110674 [Guillardia theta CCMP2712]
MLSMGKRLRASSREGGASKFTGKDEDEDEDKQPQLTVSRSSCELLLESDVQRHIDVSWDQEAQPTQRPVEIEVECEDSPGMLASMSRAISHASVNIASVVLKKLPAGYGVARFEVMVATQKDLDRVFTKLQGTKGVLHVARSGANARKSKRRRLRSSIVPPNLMSDE